MGFHFYLFFWADFVILPAAVFSSCFLSFFFIFYFFIFFPKKSSLEWLLLLHELLAVVLVSSVTIASYTGHFAWVVYKWCSRQLRNAPKYLKQKEKKMRRFVFLNNSKLL